MFSSILGLSQCSGAAILLIFWNTVVLGQDGFTNEEKIGKIASRLKDHIAYSSSNGWKIYPQLMFPCPTSINKLYVIGYIESTDTEITVDVEFMIPSQMDDLAPPSPQSTASRCTEQTVTNLSIKPSSDTIIPGFNKVLLSFDEVSIPARTIVRFRHIEGVLLYQKQNTLTSGTTCIRNAMESGDFPLIHVDTVLDCDCVGCSDGEFLSEMELNAIINQENRLIYTSAEISVIPELTFTSPGTISSWTFAGRRVFGSQDTAMPNIQIWRPSGGSRVRRQSTSDVMQYRMVNTTADMSYLMFNNDNNNIFTYHLNHSIMVRVGDIVGVEQPDNSGLFLVFQESNYINYIIEPGTSHFDVSPSHIERRQPLLRPEFQPSLQSLTSQPEPSSKSTRPTQTVSTRPSEVTESNDVPVLAIVGSVVGALVIGLIVILAVVITCLVCKAQRKKKNRFPSTPQSSQHGSVPGNNPVYEAPVNDSVEEPFYIDPIRRSELYESIRVAQVYEVPTTSLSPGQKKSNSDIKDEDNDNYHTLEPPVVSQGRMTSKEGYGEHDYHELEAPSNHSDEDTDDEPVEQSNAYSEPDEDSTTYELYVPCMEQRQSVYMTQSIKTSTRHTSSKDMIYESLREVQSSKNSELPSSSQFFEECPSFWEPGSTTDSLYQQLFNNKFREIYRHHIKVKEHLGSGQFGTVKKGVWKTAEGERKVAVKMLPPGPTSEDTVRFLQEAAIMGQFRHPNIVQLLGVVTVEEPLMIVLELLCNGDLNTYLNKSRPLIGDDSSSKDWPKILLFFCQQVAAGVDYLSEKGFVHRDIAARNILLSEDNICKISDFGMSRDLQSEDYYITRGGEIPVKWTAPETINYKKYSTASDVWSFGCLMYEIWSLGHKPFEGYTNIQTLELVDSGFRLSPPPGCPQQIYHLMIQCWHPTASQRPSPSDLLKELTRSNESSLLQWSEDDRLCHPQASTLGAPLKAGKLLYSELQQTYL